ncbi:MAG: DUF4926 domain-containing protein [Bdellovibrionales bacterium]|nr:DUF4926 domain-containing protein [Bdellovibrionales bacterium]
MPKSQDRVELTKNLPEENLKAGDRGVVVHCYQGNNAFEIEFLDQKGNTLSKSITVTLEKSHLKLVTPSKL